MGDRADIPQNADTLEKAVRKLQPDLNGVTPLLAAAGAGRGMTTHLPPWPGVPTSTNYRIGT